MNGHTPRRTKPTHTRSSCVQLTSHICRTPAFVNAAILSQRWISRVRGAVWLLRQIWICALHGHQGIRSYLHRDRPIDVCDCTDRTRQRQITTEVYAKLLWRWWQLSLKAVTAVEAGLWPSTTARRMQLFASTATRPGTGDYGSCYICLRCPCLKLISF